ncbi:MAG: epoxyqueuosine reductase QueH [Deltaproteobacteria bacterium]|nr:epoxyqueuosine reductase QueH [Deltaproteobacteria bacterium]
MKILLHICCAPCSIVPMRTLREEGHEVAGFFFNPNIHPSLEYRRRLETLQEYAHSAAFDLRVSEGYPMEEFLRGVAFREQDRCSYCYHLRLGETARTAAESGFDAFTSTLLYSKYQNHDLIRTIAESLAVQYGTAFCYRDFRDGWKEGIRLSKQMGMYRQPYCGCIYSEKERYLGAAASAGKAFASQKDKRA